MYRRFPLFLKRKPDRRMPPEIEVINTHPKIKLAKNPVRKMVQEIFRELGLSFQALNIVVVNDEHLRNLHRDYLSDDSYTDVMTFNLSEGNAIEGEIYISADRAAVQAREFGVTLSEEVGRLIIHGLLHLAGYQDLEPPQRAQMREKEDYFLNRYHNLVKNIAPETIIEFK